MEKTPACFLDAMFGKFFAFLMNNDEKISVFQQEFTNFATVFGKGNF